MILPYLLVLLTSPPLAYVADLLRAKKILSTANVRKLFQSISKIINVSNNRLKGESLNGENDVISVVMDG